MKPTTAEALDDLALDLISDAIGVDDEPPVVSDEDPGHVDGADGRSNVEFDASGEEIKHFSSLRVTYVHFDACVPQNLG